MNYFIFGDTNSADYNVFISGEATYNTPKRDIETFPIPGRNGTLTIDKKRFENIPITYPAFIVYDFRQNFDGFKARLLSTKGYTKLADTYDPDHYRLARFYSAIEPEMDQLNRHGRFKISFDCDPRRFLKTGDKVREYTAAGNIKNPTLFESLPIIRAYGTGSFTVNGVTVRINSASTYTDINSETQEAYKGTTNCNGNIQLVNGEFPTLASGTNAISMSGITKLEITPKWWTI